jgi:hypothetical protein
MSRPSYKTCHEVSALCPVKGTVLGYEPNLGANAFFAAAFFIFGIASLAIGIPKRTYIFAGCVAAGSFLEGVGMCFSPPPPTYPPPQTSSTPKDTIHRIDP